MRSKRSSCRLHKSGLLPLLSRRACAQSAGELPPSRLPTNSAWLFPCAARTTVVVTSTNNQQPRHDVAAVQPLSNAGTEQRSAKTAPTLHPLTATPYPWLQNWYPVGVVEDLPNDRPTAITIFGRKLVLWRDAAGAPAARWRCFSDECPHRMAPLSEGRIDGAGRLQCSLHGWSFDGDGRCASVPQVWLARQLPALLPRVQHCILTHTQISCTSPMSDA